MSGTRRRRSADMVAPGGGDGAGPAGDADANALPQAPDPEAWQRLAAENQDLKGKGVGSSAGDSLSTLATWLSRPSAVSWAGPRLRPRPGLPGAPEEASAGKEHAVHSAFGQRQPPSPIWGW